MRSGIRFTFLNPYFYGLHNEKSMLPLKTVLQDHLIHNLPAINTSPSKEMLLETIEFFENHHATTSKTPHFL